MREIAEGEVKRVQKGKYERNEEIKRKETKRSKDRYRPLRHRITPAASFISGAVLCSMKRAPVVAHYYQDYRESRSEERATIEIYRGLRSPSVSFARGKLGSGH